MSSGTVSRRTRITGSPLSDHSTASSAVNTTWPDAAPGDAGRPFVATGSFAHSFGSNPGREQLRQRFGIDQQDRFLRRDQLLLDQIGRDDDGGVAGALAAARLQHESRSSWIVNSKSWMSL